jgi:hypothetical protein
MCINSDQSCTEGKLLHSLLCLFNENSHCFCLALTILSNIDSGSQSKFCKEDGRRDSKAWGTQH